MDGVIIDWTGVRTKRSGYKSGEVIFAQGEPSLSVLHLERGTARLSVLASTGHTATIAIMHSGDFFGEECIARQLLRRASAIALSACTLIEIESQEFRRHLSAKPQLADLFVRHILARNIRIEADLVDHLFNVAEKRLARTLLLLARHGEGHDHVWRVLPHVSQSVLAEMVGTTRARVNVFMNKFRKLGVLEYNRDLKINTSLLAVLTADTSR
jgi:CRP-like cAMP-binding protein